VPKKKSYPTVTDQFCGCGGFSSGAAKAGCEIAIAINHWDKAVETHNTNFPNTAHDCVDISACDPRRYPSTDILITSPECTNHSLSKGRKRKNLGQLDLFNPQRIDPSEERSRATMWDVVRFAEYHQYNFVIVENVVEVRYWTLFDSWLKAMQALDYDHEEVYFNSMFAPPTPQSRDRIYIVFWKRGNPKPDLNFTPLAHCTEHGDVQAIQSWKNPHRRWGRYGKRNQYVYRCPVCAQVVEPYYTPAYTAIDWSLPSQRVRDRPRPLKAATLERICKGLKKYCGPHLLETAYGSDSSDRVRSIEGAMPTQTARQTMGLASPFILTERFTGVHRSIDDPLPTVLAGDGRVHHRLVQPFMVTLRRHHGAKGMTDPLDTVVAGGTHHGLVQPFLTSYYSASEQVSALDDPIPTVTTGDRHALVQPFLVNYYTPRISLNGINEAMATVSTQPRCYLAEPSPSITVEDCYFRMLQPCEIKRAMAFAEDYVVLGNKREQVKQCGNAVTPPIMKMLIQRCLATLGGIR
jgi:DNA (cytosine-5)-methyltransferase 1